jgi:hypothetical protein
MITFLQQITDNAAFWMLLGGLIARGIHWGYRFVRDAQIERNFVREVATNHLPHMYHVLGLICDKLEIEVTEPPQIGFVDLSAKEKK